MMHPTAILAGRGPARRGFVLLIAISVLAVLTIIVYGLAASQDLARGRSALENARQTAQGLSQLAIDICDTAPARTGDGATSASATTIDKAIDSGAAGFHTLPEGKFLIASRPAQATEPCYTAPLLAHRDGDRVAAVCVSVPLGPKHLRLTQTYLVNTAGEKARRVLLRESVKTDVQADLTAGDLKTVQGAL